ncbi:hypothetical protein QU24_02290 [Pantoea rodasii]|uniref:Uncharacterized protein n=1 Tax=Pantoea rodasii TaxID=1076549 RepID=A0A0B1RAQ5_9GAMM|nr:hypothetical protein [Pantoea rodasii]KHJ69704.1 hypothetical protein QU24_02290 [Pantoea rodasii]
MKNREAAVSVKQSVLMVVRELSISVGNIYEYEAEGKVSKEESEEYMEKVQVSLDNIISEILEPLYAVHPDLRPKCCGCEQQHESEQDQ